MLTRLSPVAATVAALHVVGLGFLVAGSQVGALSLGLGLFAYSRGLLHAIDADHLAAINGSTRKFLAEGRPAGTVGLAFSLGHSSVVVVAGLAVVLGAGWIRDAVGPDTRASQVLGWTGASISALYLLAVAAANLPALARAVRGGGGEIGHAHAPAVSGPWARLMAAPLRRVSRGRHVYLLGLLFGLGFDTASTISLLMLTAATTVSGAATVTLLGLPVLFAAGMTLGDSVNARLMRGAYQTAAGARRRLYDIVLTAVSVASAAVVGGITLANLVAEAALHREAPLDASPVGPLLVSVALVAGLTVAARRRAVVS